MTAGRHGRHCVHGIKPRTFWLGVRGSVYGYTAITLSWSGEERREDGRIKRRREEEGRRVEERMKRRRGEQKRGEEERGGQGSRGEERMKKEDKAEEERGEEQGKEEK